MGCFPPAETGTEPKGGWLLRPHDKKKKKNTRTRRTEMWKGSNYLLPFQVRCGYKFAAPLVQPSPVFGGCPHALIPVKGQGNLSSGHSHNWQFAITCAPDPNPSEKGKRAPRRCTNNTGGREHSPLNRLCKHGNAVPGASENLLRRRGGTAPQWDR